VAAKYTNSEVVVRRQDDRRVIPGGGVCLEPVDPDEASLLWTVEGTQSSQKEKEVGSGGRTARKPALGVG
jgi:hypothetical protein